MRKGVLEVDSVNALMTQLSTINKKLKKLEALAAGTQIICGICGGPHENHNCMSIQDDQFSAAQVNYVNNQPRPPYNDPHSNTYNPGNDTQEQESAEDSRSLPPKEKEEIATSPIPAEKVKKKKEPAAYIPKPPYPQRLKAKTKDKQFSKFLEMCKKLQINIPCVMQLIILWVKIGLELVGI
ncbi:hypothetical protein PIB30_088272 [Stylosanthes scabra]|uniref:Uncharacterized protein n=1 Tax=Stylosanthes scabra TaxID=79078 RepID=A0ABU6RTZ3_9FABA|nr:hypothetical protein [Stylosanthes scabra]